MIRTGPITRLGRGLSSVFQFVRSIPRKALSARKDRAEENARAAEAARGPSVQERHEQLLRFYARYETLVETLCDAAQYGPTPKLEAQYDMSRKWMQAHYAPVRTFVVAFLRYDSADSKQSLQHYRRSADAFEALFAAPSLEEFLHADDGNMITRIMRTREALNLYAEHLRQLLAREKECA